MRLLIIRHAIAEDKKKFARSGQPDRLRPITSKGRKKFKRAAKGLSKLIPRLHILATSPYLRAVQTAGIVLKHYPRLYSEELIALAPGGSKPEFLKWLKGQASSNTVAIVGHEPDLSRTLGWLVNGTLKSFLELKKGGACLVEFDDAVAPGKGKLRWALTPGLLRKI